MSQTRFVALVVAICVVAAAAGFMVARYWSQDDAVASEGEPVPRVALNDLDGRTRSLTDWPGKLVLVNFWATWCAPCIKEIPLLVAAQEKYAELGLQIVGPALDEEAAVRPMAERFKMNYPVMADFAGADAALKALGNPDGALPYSVVISRDGRILTTILGSLSEDELTRLIEALI